MTRLEEVSGFFACFLALVAGLASVAVAAVIVMQFYGIIK
jgi:hypothetical protein